MNPNPILTTKCFNNLLYQNDPFQSIFEFLFEKWCLDYYDLSNFEDNLRRIRLESFEFESLLAERNQGILPNIYDLLIQNCIEKSGNIIHQASVKQNTCVIIMDSLSIREAGIMKKILSEKVDVELNFTYSFSSLPSDTKTFEIRSIKPYMANFSDHIRLRNVSDVERINPSYPMLIFSPFPDILFHNHFAGYTEIVPIRDIFSNLIDLTEKLIKITTSFGNFDRIFITSDHGYMDRGAGSFFLTRKQISVIKSYLGGCRHSKSTPMNKEIEELINDKILYSFEDFIIVKGTYNWPIGGKFHQFLHGGISFLECFVPVISFKGI